MIQTLGNTPIQSWGAYSPPALTTTNVSLDSLTLGSDLGSTGDFLNQMASLKQMARRHQAVDSLRAGSAPELPANWDTMPLDEFLREMGRIRSSLGPSKPVKEGQKGAGPGQAAFGVNAHRYYNQSTQEWVNVRSVRVHEKGNWSRKEATAWNSGGNNEVSTKKENAELGKTYQVEVIWEDGTSKVWDYTNNGQTVDVWGPNS